MLFRSGCAIGSLKNTTAARSCAGLWAGDRLTCGCAPGGSSGGGSSAPAGPEDVGKNGRPAEAEANGSPTDDPFYRALASHAVAGRTDAVAGPALSVGFTDSLLLRPLGVHAYGFSPFEVTLEDAERQHGHGENVPVAALGDGLRILLGAVIEVSAVDPERPVPG